MIDRYRGTDLIFPPNNSYIQHDDFWRFDTTFKSRENERGLQNVKSRLSHSRERSKRDDITAHVHTKTEPVY